MKYGPHKSSIFDLDANVAALLVYLLPWLVSLVSQSLSTIAWVIPLIIFILEKNSRFVTYHAANALAFYIVEAIFYLLSLILGTTAVITSWIARITIIGSIADGILGILALALGIFYLAVLLYLMIGKIISAIKGYNYQEAQFPIINIMTSFILNLKR